ncbi:MAG: response regulator [Rhodospirillales bacterium]|nr:response regulator [Rhodospirillales bacterium]
MTPVQFLLVDDLEENLLALETLLRRDGLVTLKARSGDEALEILLRHDVALALIDVQMPGLNGFELAELMRGKERARHIPIIFVTAGTADSQRRFRGYEAGAVDFIQKPIEPDILRSKAEVFFELGRQRQQIAAQRDELMLQAKALKEADHRKDEFLATLSHELRNPLAPLRYGLDALCSDPDGEDAARIRAAMDRQLVHLVRLIDDLLDISRVSQGKIALRKARIDAADVVRAAVEGSRPVIDAARHTLAIDLPPDPLWLEADLTRLSQVVGNLLNNAAKYTPEGGRIRLSVRAEGDAAVIEIADNGLGIPTEMQARVFQLFAQVDTHLGRAQGGLGIGLALARQLVALHDGTIAVQSAGAGKGSTFTVRLPLAALAKPGAANGADAAAVTAQKRQRGLKVLVVDDNEDVAEAISWALKALGHDYRLIHDGRQTLDAARDYRPDAVLLDIGLPIMDGYAVCRALRADALFKDIPIIAQSGWGQDHDKASAAEAGFTHHLTKPVSRNDLAQTLARISVGAQV